MHIEIRPATAADIPSIHSIYRDSVLHDTASWELTPPTQEEMWSRVNAILGRNLPFFVAVVDQQVRGYTYAGSYHSRAGYRFTVENSIYMDAAHHRLGIGAKLLSSLIDTCTSQGYRQMVAVIGGSDRVASVTLHQKLGFQHAGLLTNIGLKQDRWLDCVYMQRALGAGHSTLPES